MLPPKRTAQKKADPPKSKYQDPNAVKMFLLSV